MKKKASALKTELEDASFFSEFYKWLFDHMREDEKKRTIRMNAIEDNDRMRWVSHCVCVCVCVSYGPGSASLESGFHFFKNAPTGAIFALLGRIRIACFLEGSVDTKL